MSNSQLKYLKYFLLAALIYMPVFGNLSTLPIRIWDESRLAMNAYEMLNNGDFIVTHFDGNPDMWNTKPPFLIWFQVLMMKIIDVNELAVRLPSAFAAFLTCMALLTFSLYYLRSFWFGFIATVVLITSYGYIDVHATRTGDYDAMLTLFTTVSGLSFFIYCENEKKKYLYLFFLFTAIAVLTKSVTGLLFLPAIFIYSIVQRQFLPLLKSKHFYIGLFSFLMIVAGYYLLREHYNPGFIAAVYDNELGGRYLEVLDNHQHEFLYYYNNLIDYKLAEWYLIIPLGVITGLIIKDQRIRNITWFSLMMIITFFLVISSAQTKLEWYDVPLYPFFSLLIAIFIYFIFNILKNIKMKNQAISYGLALLFLVYIFFTPYKKIFNKTFKPEEFVWHKEFYEISYYLKDAVKGKYELNDHFLLYDGYNAHNLFYLKILNDKGIRISGKDWKDLRDQDVVVAFQKNVKEYIEEHYTYDLVKLNGNIATYIIHDSR